MKKLLLLFYFFISVNCFAQCFDGYFCITFDDTTCLSRITIDTVAYPGNVWQTGHAVKPGLDAGVCQTKLIMTDTVHPYPVNNHSVFTLVKYATFEDVYGLRNFQASYYVQTDSLNDYGTMEFSLDKGVTWINVLDTTYNNNIHWWSPPPVFTGRSYTCRNIDMFFENLISIHNFSVGDTILYRFSFFSDSTFDNLGGLVFDDLCFSGFVEGMSEIHFTAIHSVIYPNPIGDHFTISFDNPDALPFELAVYTIESKRVLTRPGITSNKIEIKSGELPPGMYVYKITNEEVKKRCWGKFIVTKR